MEEYFRQCSIEEASIMFSSNHYSQLKCKIVDRMTEHVISSSFISNCIECYIPICRKITDFLIELWDCSTKIAKFQFAEEDIECSNDPFFLSHKESIQSARYGSDHIRLRKQTDECCLYFKVYEEDLEKEANPFFFASEFHLQVVQEFYQKMVSKAMKKMEKFSGLKRSEKRYTILEKREEAKPSIEQKFSSSLGFKQMKLPKRSFLENLDKNRAQRHQFSSKIKSNLQREYDFFKKHFKKQRMKTVGMEELVSDKIQASFPCFEVYKQRDGKIISENGFLLGAKRIQGKTSRKSLKNMERKDNQRQSKEMGQQNKAKQKIKSHRRYASLV